jgi:hypothetical protein
MIRPAQLRQRRSRHLSTPVLGLCRLMAAQRMAMSRCWTSSIGLVERRTRAMVMAPSMAEMQSRAMSDASASSRPSLSRTAASADSQSLTTPATAAPSSGSAYASCATAPIGQPARKSLSTSWDV